MTSGSWTLLSLENIENQYFNIFNEEFVHDNQEQRKILETSIIEKPCRDRTIFPELHFSFPPVLLKVDVLILMLISKDSYQIFFYSCLKETWFKLNFSAVSLSQMKTPNCNKENFN